MPANINNSIKNDIKRVNPDTLVNRGYAQAAPTSGIVCPHCGNGTHEMGTGIDFKQDANGFWKGHCFRCGENFDILRLVAEHFGYNLQSDFPKVVAEGATLLGASASFSDFRHNHNAKKNFTADKKAEDKKDAPPPDYQKFLDGAHITLQNLPEVSRRGFDLATLANFANGFQKDWQHPNSPNMPKSNRWIIPTSAHHYLALAIDPNTPEKYRKIHVGKKEIFNLRDLKNFCTTLVVEGELDAMSIWQATNGLIPVIAVSGCSNYKVLLDYLKKHPELQFQFISVFDDDSKEGNAGQTNAKKFVSELIKLGYPAVNRLLSDSGRKDFDANDWLQENQDALRDRLFDIYDESVSELELVAAEIQAEKDFQAAVDDFVNANGEIPDGVLAEIKAATELLNSFDIDNFDARLFSDESFHRKLGLCSFYTFANFALYNLTTVFIAKRKLTLQKIKLGVAIKDTEKPLLTLSDSDLKKITKNATKAVAAQHEDFNREQKQKQREEYQRQKQAEEKQATSDNLERLAYLKTLPPSPERNKEIRFLVNQLCEWQLDRYGNQLFVKPDIENYDLMFKFDPTIENLFAYDEFNRATVFTKEPYWRNKANPDFICSSEKKKYSDSPSYIGEPIQTEDKHALANYLARTYGKINAYRLFERAFNEYAMKNSFNPVKQFFNNLPKWDGVPRVERIFVDFLQADDTPYTREVTFKSFLASVARVYYPGCNWQVMPILQGQQGTGKSFLLQKIAGKWYTELFENLADSHAMDAIEGALIVEMAELDSWHGVRANTLKSFVSRSDDKRRKAYDKSKSSNLRSCTFWGTSNNTQLLPDLTGNRRFPIIKCHAEFNQVKYGLSDEYVAQFWAELTTKFYKMADEDGGHFNFERLRFSDETLQKIEEIAKDYIFDDGLTGEILAAVDYRIPYKSVWRLLSRDEHQQFFQNGGFISISEQDLRARQNVRRRPDELTELEDVLALADIEDDYSVQSVDGKLTFFGVHPRDTICAAEIYNENFYNSDRRVSICKIAEILAQNLDSKLWHRERRKHRLYGDQRNTFCQDFADSDPLNATQVQTSQTHEPDNVIVTNENLQNSSPDTSQSVDSKASENDVADDVTIVSSQNFDSDEEEFLTDEDYEELHQLTRNLRHGPR